MDRLKEDFEELKDINEEMHLNFKIYREEIHRLEQVATENSDWFDCLKIDFDKQAKEIKKLKNALENIIAYTYPPRRDISGGCYYKAKRALEDVDA